MDHASGAASPATSTEQQSLHSRNTRPTAADRDRDSIEPISQLSAPTTPLPGPSRAASSSSRHRSTPGNDYDARPTPVAKQFDTKSARAEENELPVPALADREKKPKSIGKWILFFLPRFDRKWLLLLLPIVPAGFAVNYTHGPSLVTFIVNFLAIIPMSLATGLCLKRVNIRIGPNLGGLLYITFRLVPLLPKMRSIMTEPQQSSSDRLFSLTTPDWPVRRIADGSDRRDSLQCPSLSRSLAALWRAEPRRTALQCYRCPDISYHDDASSDQSHRSNGFTSAITNK